MANSVLSSTLLLTLLLSVGLFFFIRASTKDRIQVVKLLSEQPEESLLVQIQQYFSQRAYRVTAVDAAENRVTFEGVVRPSIFLAIFLSALAGIGILCLVLVLSMLLPKLFIGLSVLVLLAPLAGLFYWRGAERPETVILKVEAGNVADQPQSVITVSAHRDELAELKRSLSLKPLGG